MKEDEMKRFQVFSKRRNSILFRVLSIEWLTAFSSDTWDESSAVAEVFHWQGRRRRIPHFSSNWSTVSSVSSGAVLVHSLPCSAGRKCSKWISVSSAPVLGQFGSFSADWFCVPALIQVPFWVAVRGVLGCFRCGSGCFLLAVGAAFFCSFFFGLKALMATLQSVNLTRGPDHLSYF